MARFYRLVRLVVDLLVLRGRRDRSKDVEILVLRHQLAVLQRQISRPRFMRGRASRSVTVLSQPEGGIVVDVEADSVTLVLGVFARSKLKVAPDAEDVRLPVELRGGPCLYFLMMVKPRPRGVRHGLSRGPETCPAGLSNTFQ